MQADFNIVLLLTSHQMKVTKLLYQMMIVSHACTQPAGCILLEGSWLTDKITLLSITSGMCIAYSQIAYSAESEIDSACSPASVYMSASVAVVVVIVVPHTQTALHPDNE